MEGIIGRHHGSQRLTGGRSASSFTPARAAALNILSLLPQDEHPGLQYSSKEGGNTSFSITATHVCILC